MSGRRRWTAALKSARLIRLIRHTAPPPLSRLDQHARLTRPSSRAVSRLVEEALSARDDILSRVRGAIAPAQPPRRDPPRLPQATDDDIQTFLDRLAHYEAKTTPSGQNDLDQTVRELLSDRKIVAPAGVPDQWVPAPTP